MQPVTVRITPHDGRNGGSFELYAPNVQTALAVTEINVDHGTAEIRDGDRLLARLSRRGQGTATYWVVG